MRRTPPKGDPRYCRNAKGPVPRPHAIEFTATKVEDAHQRITWAVTEACTHDGCGYSECYLRTYNYALVEDLALLGVDFDARFLDD